MILVVQIVSVLVAIICIGQAIKNGATKFDKISFCVFALSSWLFALAYRR